MLLLERRVHRKLQAVVDDSKEVKMDEPILHMLDLVHRVIQNLLSSSVLIDREVRSMLNFLLQRHFTT